MNNNQRPEVQFALDAVRQASLLVRLIQSEMVSPALTKEDRSPVTIADFASQALVARLLQLAYPDDPLVAEEDSAVLRTPEEHQTLERVASYVARFLPGAAPDTVSGWIDRGAASTAPRFWTLDPIDGTKGFLRGDQYVAALALVEDGQVQVAVLGCPNLVDGYLPSPGGPGSLVVAERGQGSWTASMDSPARFSEMHVSKLTHPARARILRSYESSHTNVDQVDEFSQELNVQAAPVRMDSQAKYAVLAAGQGDLYVRLLSPKQPDYKEKIWDQAAGSLIISEAGGTVTDLDGMPLDFSHGRTLAHNRGILASNSFLHERALEVLRRVGA